MGLIDRQAALDIFDDYNVAVENGQIEAYSRDRKRLCELQPAQPEIIYCKDCKHFVRDDIEEYTPYGFYNTYFHAFCDKHWDNEQGEYIDVKIDDFCSFAERREVTT